MVPPTKNRQNFEHQSKRIDRSPENIEKMLNQETANGIVFSSSSNGDEDIYIMNKMGEDVQRLTTISNKGETNRTPEWSTDRLQIAFQSNREGPREIYILTIATGDIRRLTYSNGNCNHPAWSPDGKQISRWIK